MSKVYAGGALGEMDRLRLKPRETREVTWQCMDRGCFYVFFFFFFFFWGEVLFVFLVFLGQGDEKKTPEDYVA